VELIDFSVIPLIIKEGTGGPTVDKQNKYPEVRELPHFNKSSNRRKL